MEEFSYFLQRMKSIPEGDGNLLDRTCCVYIHEHAEANPHKCNGLAIMVAGGGIKGGMHTKSHNSIGDVYLTIADEHKALQPCRMSILALRELPAT